MLTLAASSHTHTLSCVKANLRASNHSMHLHLMIYEIVLVYLSSLIPNCTAFERLPRFNPNSDGSDQAL